MAKGNRKRTAKKEVAKPKPSILPLQQAETRYFEELVQLSNVYAKLKKQVGQYEYVLKQLNDHRTKIQKGEIKTPIMMQLGANSFYMEEDKKQVLADLDKQIETIKNSLKAVQGQLKHREDDFIESGLRLRAFSDRRFGSYKIKKIAPERKDHEEEKEIFSADFDKLMNDPKLQKEFLEKKQEAIKANEKAAESKA